MFEIFFPIKPQNEKINNIEDNVVFWTYDSKSNGYMWPKKDILKWLRSNIEYGTWTYAIGKPIKVGLITGIYLYFDRLEDLILFKLSYIQ